MDVPDPRTSKPHGLNPFNGAGTTVKRVFYLGIHMKKVAALLMMFACGSAIAAPATCEEIAKFTSGLATARQNGVPLSEVLKILGKNGVSNNMALAIYSQPQYHTEEMQKRAIVEAENSALIGCLKGSASK